MQQERGVGIWTENMWNRFRCEMHPNTMFIFLRQGYHSTVVDWLCMNVFRNSVHVLFIQYTTFLQFHPWEEVNAFLKSKSIVPNLIMIPVNVITDYRELQCCKMSIFYCTELLLVLAVSLNAYFFFNNKNNCFYCHNVKCQCLFFNIYYLFNVGNSYCTLQISFWEKARANGWAYTTVYWTVQGRP